MLLTSEKETDHMYIREESKHVIRKCKNLQELMAFSQLSLPLGFLGQCYCMITHRVPQWVHSLVKEDGNGQSSYVYRNNSSDSSDVEDSAKK